MDSIIYGDIVVANKEDGIKPVLKTMYRKV
jgi:hypothetical protein